jgi:hypothetical protein
MVPCRRDLLVPILIAPPPHVGEIFRLGIASSLDHARKDTTATEPSSTRPMHPQRSCCMTFRTRQNRAPRTNRSRSLPLSPRCFDDDAHSPAAAPAAAVGLAWRPVASNVSVRRRRVAKVRCRSGRSALTAATDRLLVSYPSQFCRESALHPRRFLFQALCSVSPPC